MSVTKNYGFLIGLSNDCSKNIKEVNYFEMLLMNISKIWLAKLLIFNVFAVSRNILERQTIKDTNVKLFKAVDASVFLCNCKLDNVIGCLEQYCVTWYKNTFQEHQAYLRTVKSSTGLIIWQISLSEKNLNIPCLRTGKITHKTHKISLYKE